MPDSSIYDNQGFLKCEHERHPESNEEYKSLLEVIIVGSMSRRSEVSPLLRDYWWVRDRLFVHRESVIMKDRVVVHTELRHQVSNGLHAAHQGLRNMPSRARQLVYWPGMLGGRHYRCAHCNEGTPNTPQPSIQKFLEDWGLPR